MKMIPIINYYVFLSFKSENGVSLIHPHGPKNLERANQNFPGTSTFFRTLQFRESEYHKYSRYSFAYTKIYSEANVIFLEKLSSSVQAKFF